MTKKLKISMINDDRSEGITSMKNLTSFLYTYRIKFDGLIFFMTETSFPSMELLSM